MTCPATIRLPDDGLLWCQLPEGHDGNHRSTDDDARPTWWTPTNTRDGT